MRLKYLIIIVLTSSFFTSSGQNIVENGSFEVLTGKPKNPGEVFLAPPWVAGTKAIPDIYSPSAKDDRIKVPVNAYGEQKPKDGKNYAGLLIYSNKEVKPRSYLTAQLKYPMLAGENYCVKFHICFADLSKYASNSIGLYISQDSIGSETDLILKYEPQIINSTNRIFEKQWDWEDICRIYVAEGGENFITIGNFAPQIETRTLSVRRPAGFTATQIRDGYYFIDDITITPNGTPENCKCEPGNFAFANLNKQEAEFKTDDADIPDRVIIGTTGTLPGAAKTAKETYNDVIIDFALAKSNLDAKNTATLDNTAKLLTEKPLLKVTLVGHKDNSESVVEGLSTKRIEQVAKYLISKGIAESRIGSKDAEDKEPLETTGAKEKRHLNMVVEIKISE